MRIANKQTAEHNATSIHFFLVTFHWFWKWTLWQAAAATGGITILWAAQISPSPSAVQWVRGMVN